MPAAITQTQDECILGAIRAWDKVTVEAVVGCPQARLLSCFLPSGELVGARIVLADGTMGRRYLGHDFVSGGTDGHEEGSQGIRLFGSDVDGAVEWLREEVVS